MQSRYWIKYIQVVAKMQLESLIIFISHKDELVYSTFTVKPFRFIRKICFEQEALKLVKDIIEEIHLMEEKKSIIIRANQNELFSFDISKTVYIEACGKNCKIIGVIEHAMVKCRFTDVETIFLKHKFIKIHRSFLVNYRYIFSIKRDEFLKYHIGGE